MTDSLAKIDRLKIAKAWIEAALVFTLNSNHGRWTLFLFELTLVGFYD
jgi:hypothetical protein